MPEINRQGIAVKYLAFPRAGVGSSSFKDMESVWCSSDKNKALTEAKLSGKVRKAECKNPVATQFMLGREIGVRGTPAIYLENGKYLSGYLPPDELIKALEDKHN